MPTLTLRNPGNNVASALFAITALDTATITTFGPTQIVMSNGDTTYTINGTGLQVAESGGVGFISAGTVDAILIRDSLNSDDYDLTGLNLDGAALGFAISIETDIARSDLETMFLGLTWTIVGSTGDDTHETPLNSHDGIPLTLTGNNTYALGNGNDFITHVGTGNDTLSGGAGNDLLRGNGGNDVIDGGADDDALEGGAGNDTLHSGDGGDRVFGGEGNDTIRTTGDGSSDTAFGGVGNDSFILSNVFFAGNIHGDDGTDDHVDASAYDPFPLIVDLAAGSYNDSGAIFAMTGIEHVTGGSGDDSFLGDDGANRLTGNGGADILQGGLGNDTLSGGDGIDSLSGGDGDDRLDGGLGTEDSFGGNGNDLFIQGRDAGNDNFFGGTGTDTLDMSAVADILTVSLGGGTWTFGQATGIENVIGGRSFNTLFGSDHDNHITGGRTDDLIAGGLGNDTLIADLGSDRLSGNGGNDVMSADGVQNDSLFGGDGNDTLDLSASPQAFAFSTETGRDTGLPGNLFQGFETFLFGGRNDSITTHSGGIVAETVHAGAGDDRLTDTSITGPGQQDSYDGGTGTDTLNFTGLAGGQHLVDMVQGILFFGSDAHDRFAGFENVAIAQGAHSIIGNGADNELTTGGDFDNFIDGGGGNDDIRTGEGTDAALGGDGDDQIILGGSGTAAGGNGNDTLRLIGVSAGELLGDAGNDTLYGGSGGDQLGGGADDDLLEGGAGSDALAGDGGNDSLSGGQGDDSLYGGDGDDTFLGSGLAGDRDESYGESGNDRFVMSNDFSMGRVNGGNGLDHLDGSGVTSGLGLSIDLGVFRFVDQFGNTFGLEHIEQATGGQQGDTLVGTTGGNALDGQGGADTIFGDSGEDSLTGGQGSDTLEGGADADQLYGGAGNDTLEGGAGADLMAGDAGADLIAGGTGNDTFLLGTGDLNLGDIFDGDGGTDALLLSGLTADVVVNLATAQISLGGGGPLAQVHEIEVVHAGSGNDSLTGDLEANMLLGLGGNDTLEGGGGNDVLDGGSGNDAMFGGGGNDRFIVAAAGDAVSEVGGSGIDTVLSYLVGYTLGADIERLELAGAAVTGTGNALDNTLVGTTLDNTLNGGAGNDYMVGGTGNDAYFVGAAGDTVIEYEAQGTDTVRSYLAAYTLGAHVERLELQGAAAAGTGNALANTLVGTALDNTLNGGGGNDYMVGNAGNDVLDGGSGNDAMFGGAGNDRFIVAAAGDAVSEAGGSGIDTVLSYLVGYTLGAGLERLELAGAAVTGTGNGSDNTLVGTALGNTLNGGAGNDYMVGNAGNDVLDGGSGNDAMFGGAGNDRFLVDAAGDAVSETGGSGTDTVVSSLASYTLGAGLERLELAGAAMTGIGNGSDNTLAGTALGNTLQGAGGTDYLLGGGGNDMLFGGTGTDTFVFGAALSATNVDRIIDFSVVHDVMRLDDAFFSGLSGGLLAGSAFTSNLTGLATTTSHRIIYESDTGALFFDSDGTGSTARVQFALLTAGLSLAATDFVVF